MIGSKPSSWWTVKGTRVCILANYKINVGVDCWVQKALLCSWVGNRSCYSVSNKLDPQARVECCVFTDRIFFFFLVLPLYCYQPISLHPHAHMLSHVIPWTSACQTPLSMDFSRQEYWSGLPLLIEFLTLDDFREQSFSVSKKACPWEK